MKIARVIVSAAAAIALTAGGTQMAGAQEKELGAQTAGQNAGPLLEGNSEEHGSADQLSSLSSEGLASGGADDGANDKADAETAETIAMSSEVAGDVFGPLAPLVLALAPLLAGLLGVLDVITDALGGIAHLGFAASQ